MKQKYRKLDIRNNTDHYATIYKETSEFQVRDDSDAFSNNSIPDSLYVYFYIDEDGYTHATTCMVYAVNSGSKPVTLFINGISFLDSDGQVISDKPNIKLANRQVILPADSSPHYICSISSSYRASTFPVGHYTAYYTDCGRVNSVEGEIVNE